MSLSVRHDFCGDTSTVLSGFSFRRRYFLTPNLSPFRRSKAEVGISLQLKGWFRIKLNRTFPLSRTIEKSLCIALKYFVSLQIILFNMEKEQVKPDNSAHNKSKLKVGIFCIVAVIIFYLGACFFKGVSAFGKKTYYYAIFDNTGGLQASNAVMLNGYKIGQVTNVSIISDNPVRLCAELMITEDVNIPKDSKVQVAPKDLLGGTVVNILFGSDTRYLQDKDTMQAYVVPPMTDGIDELKAQLGSILSSVDTITLSLKDVLAPDAGGQDLKSTLANLESTTENLTYILSANKDKVGKLVTNLEQFSNTLQAAGPQLESIVENMDNITDSLSKANVRQTINDAQKAVGDIQLIVDKMQRGEGTLGQLVNNDSLYLNLEHSLYSLNELLVDLKANPKKYINVTVFGKKEKNK